MRRRSRGPERTMVQAKALQALRRNGSFLMGIPKGTSQLSGLERRVRVGTFEV